MFYREFFFFFFSLLFWSFLTALILACFWPKLHNQTLSKPEEFVVTIQVFFLAYFFLFWITHFSTHFSSFSFTPFFHFILAAEDSGRSQEGLGLFLGERKNLDILQDMGNFSPLIYWLHSNSPMRSSSLRYFIYPFFALWLGKTAWLVTPGGPELQRKGNLVKVCWGITRLTLLI